MIIQTEYKDNALLYYQGPFTVNFISYMGNYFQSFLPQDAKFLQRAFRAFVELTQNVSYYSADKTETKNGIHCGTGWFSIQEIKGNYRLSTGNLIKTSDRLKLEAYCNEINTSSEDQLRKLKREIRSKSLMNDVIAQIGLIQIGIISSNKLDYHITEINKKHSFFVLSVVLEH